MANKKIFERGDQVEVCGKEEGFQGSYYPATVISWLGEGDYIVQYATLLGEDESRRLLREIVSETDLRPQPPTPEGTDDHYHPQEAPRAGDHVDARDNDGWWHGTVVRRWREEDVDGSLAPNRWRVQVTFEKTTGDRKIYRSKDIRFHVDWVHGNWVRPTRPPGRNCV